jgi:hypothetical protein
MLQGAAAESLGMANAGKPQGGPAEPRSPTRGPSRLLSQPSMESDLRAAQGVATRRDVAGGQPASGSKTIRPSHMRGAA